MIMNRICLSALAIMFAMNVSAQETKSTTYPHAFVGVQGGVMRAYNGVGIDRKWNPMGAVSLGYNFTSAFGLRLQANGSMWKAKLPDGSEYKSKAANIDLDMMFNLSNIFFPNTNNFVNVIAIAGAPFNIAIPHAWVDNYAFATADGTDRWNPAWKVGGMVEFNVAKNWGVNLEAGTNYVRQKNSVNIDNDKWWPYAMAGITYKFGQKKVKKEAPVVETTYVEPVKEEPKYVQRKVEQPAVTRKVETVVVKKAEPLKENVFFDLAKSDIKAEQASKIDQIVKWANENPNATITLKGYADKATGTPDTNKKIAKKRVETIKKALTDKGISENRIKAEVIGDAKQPFANSDDNRAVIIESEE